MTALPLHIRSLPLRHPSATGAPWLVAAFLTGVFFFANSNMEAARMWQETSSADVTAMVARISEGQAGRQLAFLTLAVVGTVGVLLPARRRLRIDLLVLYPLVLLSAWCVLSVLWSHAPALTAKRLIVFYALAVSVVAVVRRYGLGILVPIALTYGAMALCLGVIAEAWMRSNPFAAGYRFAGTMHPNHTGLAMALLLLSSLALADWNDRRRRWFFALAGVALVALVATGSRTALFAGVTAAITMTVLRWPLRRLLLIGFPCLWTVLLAGTLYSLDLIPPVWEKALLSRDDSDVRTLTGRTEIWGFALHQLARNEERLLIGFGYDSFWTPQMALAVSRFVQFKISEGHSAYIDATLELGLIGAGLFVFLLVAALWRWTVVAWKTKAASTAFAAAIVVMAIVHGVAESAFIDPHLWTLLLFTSIGFAALARPAVANRLRQPGGVA